MQLQGKVALITGGTSGIGHATALAFQRAGAQVVVTGLNTVEQAKRTLPAEVLALRSDVRSEADRRALTEQIRTQFGRLDIAFFNAGIAQLAPFSDSDELMYTNTFDTNVKAVVLGLQALLPLFVAGGSVIVNTSVAALRAAPNMSLYAASKGAVSALVRTLAVELAPQRIRVNALAPAMVETAIQAKFALPPEVQAAVHESYTQRIPVGRWGRAEEVAELALYLASDAAAYVTGVEIPIDGGLMQS
jgi:NAD(P)-dependent dehydrogenase (short-subunit alcohol dehydrogenase family)